MPIPTSTPLNNTTLPKHEIPGNYGLPFLGPLKDRWDYFYHQGRYSFFKSRAEKYNSTVFRTNMPPGPWVSPDPRVVVLLDAISFPILFDNSKVDKKDIFVGTFMPSTSFAGGYRALAYLDTSEPKHGLLKSMIQSLIASKHNEFVPVFRNGLQSFFTQLEDQLEEKKGVELRPLTDTLSFEFLFKLFCDGKSPLDTKIESNGIKIIKKWQICQIAPLVTLGLPKILNPIEDFIFHSIKLPFFLVKNDYKKLYDAFNSSATTYLEKAENNGISREEACHTLVYMFGFNAFAGISVWFPILIKWVATQGPNLHRQLADEIRTVVKSEGGVTLNSIKKMALTKSVVYEAFRIEPPVPYQYGRAKQDLIVNSHDASYEIKKGEVIFGYQPFATKDPKIFENPEVFESHRFIGEGEKMLKYVLWSNGRETEDPTPENKQCPGKDLSVQLSMILLVEFFLRYDTISVHVKPSFLSDVVTVLSLTKATSM
ncbi:allene oxide synthase 3-like [Silene latifolia]|uniref:allene oxide synthase 3-like n=1 Tax=Silene latifolia TaxID=37657 RepID=UPI003D774F71